MFPEETFIDDLKDLGIFSGKVEDDGSGLEILRITC
jgi:hypothetical protein